MKARRVTLRRLIAPAASSSSNAPAPEEPHLSSQSPLKFRPKDILFLQIIASSIDDLPFFDLPEKYGVQDLAPRGRRNSDQGIPYLLGSGTSCHVIQHETGDDTSQIVPKGSLVALKVYRQEGVNYSAPSSTASRELAQVIWQDLRVLCHPNLRYHENFCKVLYVGWEPYSLVPILALELAAFGSLEDAIQSESDLSPTQKANISMDIATGLSTLHDCGFVHGDIKPSNIMIQSHTERQVVAKILDFSGVTDLSSFGTISHKSYMTKLWLAPEVLLGSLAIDWKKVDVYAYGLILAHMWSYKDLDLTEIFLETSLPAHLDATEKQDFLLYYKCCPDEEYMSVVRQALRTVFDPSNNDDSIYVGVPLDHLIRNTLAYDVGKRESMSELMLHFKELALAHGRTISSPPGQAEAQAAEKQRWRDASDHNFFVFSRAFTERSNVHKQMTLEHMKVVSGEPLLDKSPLLAGTDSDYEAPYPLWMLILRNDSALDSVDDAEHYRRVLHYQIAACLLQGHGSKVDNINALNFLASAALGGIKRAMNMFHQVEASCGIRLSIQLPRRLFLVLGHLNGCSEASDTLRTHEPGAYATAQALLNLIQWTDLAEDAGFLRVVLPRQSSIVWDDATGLSKDVRSCHGDSVIFSAIENGDIAWVESLLAQGLSPKTLNHSGMSPLHALALIEDGIAAQMVDLLVRAGARADHEVFEPFAYWKNRSCNGRGTPLLWAVVKNKPLLFERLLYLGCSYEISAYQYLPTTFLLIASLRRHQMMVSLSHFPDILTAALGGNFRREILYNALKRCIEAHDDGESIGRRWSLGHDFQGSREATAHLLLQMGAEPIGEGLNNGRSPLAHAILQGDATCVRAFVKHLECEGADVTSLMSHTGVLRGGHGGTISWSALRGSLTAPCKTAFLYILDRFESTIDQLSAHGLSPLSYAASEGDAFAVDELLKHGARFLPSDQGSSPFVDALCNGSTEVAAKILYHLGKHELLAPNPRSQGHNAFGLVLHTYASGRRHIGLDSFRFLQGVGGLSFITNETTRETSFQVLLRRGRPSYHEQRSRDLTLLKYFLQNDTFHNHVNDVSNKGFGALHYAAIHVYTEAAEILLERGADANLETAVPDSIGQNNRSAVGWTALDYAVNSYIHGAPKDIKFGGSTEIRAWKQRLERLIKVLVDYKGTNGSKAPGLYGMHVKKILDPSTWRHFHIQYALNPTPGDQTWRGKWPQRIPRCPQISTSRKKATNSVGDTAPESDTNSDNEETTSRPRDRTFIYRTRKGKKIKTSEMMMQTLGAMMESASEEEGEITKEHTRQELKHARSAVRTRLAEQSMARLSLLSDI